MDAENRINPALRRARLYYPPLTNYFSCAEEVEPSPIIIIGRESSDYQNEQGELNWQRSLYRRLFGELGFDVLRTFGEIGSGYKRWRPKLDEAFAYARRHNAKVGFEAVNRCLRPEQYHYLHNPDAEYDHRDLERMAQRADGLVLCTYFHPNMSEREVHGHQTERGLMKPPLRGSKKAENETIKDVVLELFAQGYSQAEIKHLTGAPSSNISRWIAARTARSVL